jgi:hypothetical protein
LRLTVIALAVLIGSGPAFGQRVSFGFVGGTNLTRDFPISRTIYLDPSHPDGLTTFDLFSDTHSFLDPSKWRYGKDFRSKGTHYIGN